MGDKPGSTPFSDPMAFISANPTPYERQVAKNQMYELRSVDRLFGHYPESGVLFGLATIRPELGFQFPNRSAQGWSSVNRYQFPCFSEIGRF
jgi:hypothetical protein